MGIRPHLYPLRVLFVVAGVIVGIILQKVMRHAADFVQLVTVDTMTAEFDLKEE